ncbi:hypothetical protein LPJ57_005243 [Coemansia sp. RSA 486]|nr:hypothetical protein LPJ57_005243 [Coemansia sp. RSA 486]
MADSGITGTLGPPREGSTRGDAWLADSSSSFISASNMLCVFTGSGVAGVESALLLAARPRCDGVRPPGPSTSERGRSSRGLRPSEELLRQPREPPESTLNGLGGPLPAVRAVCCLKREMSPKPVMSPVRWFCSLRPLPLGPPTVFQPLRRPPGPSPRPACDSERRPTLDVVRRILSFSALARSASSWISAMVFGPAITAPPWVQPDWRSSITSCSIKRMRDARLLLTAIAATRPKYASMYFLASLWSSLLPAVVSSLESDSVSSSSGDS